MAPRGKKGKVRAPVQAQEEGGELPPIPEDTGNEGYDNYGQSGEAWHIEGSALQNYSQGDQWGHQPGSQAEAWDTNQYPQQQQDWGVMTNSPAPMNTPIPPGPPSGPAAFAAWNHNPQNPQGPYGPPRQPPMAQPPPPPPPPPPAGPPPGVPLSRSRQESGMHSAATSWHNWGAEAMANSRQHPLSPTQPPGTGYGHQGRVTFASHESYVPSVNRDENTPQAQQMIFDSIMNSRGGAPAPKQPHQRPARGAATHSTKHSKKSKKEKRAQEQSAPNAWDKQQEDYGWDQDNAGWDQDNTGWAQDNAQYDKEGGYGWGQQDGDWREKQDPAWDQWASGGDARRDDLDSEGYTDSEGWNDVTGRGKPHRNVSNTLLHALAPQSPYPVSRTMAYANGIVPPPVDAPSPTFSRRSNSKTINDYANAEFLTSFGEAIRPVENALFGRERKARDRIHWEFPHEKDERVRKALEWLGKHARTIAVFGLNRFLETRERGALFINASYDSPTSGGPGVEWLMYDDVVETRDRLLQESVGFYDPLTQVIVFVFLPSKTGNSLAMWRRKVPVPDSVGLPRRKEIGLALAALRKDYTVLVDEVQDTTAYLNPPYRLSQASGTPKKKKKGFFRRLFRIFKIAW